MTFQVFALKCERSFRHIFRQIRLCGPKLPRDGKAIFDGTYALNVAENLLRHLFGEERLRLSPDGQSAGVIGLVMNFTAA